MSVLIAVLGVVSVGCLLWALSLRRRLVETTRAMEHAACEGRFLLDLWQVLLEEVELPELLRRAAHYLERELCPCQPVALFIAEGERLEMAAWKNLGEREIEVAFRSLTHPDDPNARFLFSHQEAVYLNARATAFPIMIDWGTQDKRLVIGALALPARSEDRKLIDEICFALGIGISRATAFMLVRDQRDAEQARAEAVLAELRGRRPGPGRRGQPHR